MIVSFVFSQHWTQPVLFSIVIRFVFVSIPPLFNVTETFKWLPLNLQLSGHYIFYPKIMKNCNLQAEATDIPTKNKKQMIKNLMIEVFDSDWIYREVFLEKYLPKPRGKTRCGRLMS